MSDPHTTLTGIRLSPLSWDMQVTIRELAGEELGFGRMYDRVTSVQLLHEDGTLTEAPVRPNSASGDQTLEGEYMITTVRQGSSFPQPVDLSDVIGVVIEGREYLLSPAP